jgi:uncharacterized protein YcaQ
VLPSSRNAEVASRQEYEQFMVQKYMRAHGLVDTRHWRFGWLPLKISERRAIINRMVEEGKLCPIKIEGIKHKYYVLAEYLPILENPETVMREETLFVAPLDNLLWNRRMISEIFNFD